MSARTLIVVTDPKVEADRLRQAIAQAAGDPMVRVEVLVAAVMPAALPITAREPALTARLNRLCEIAAQEITRLHARGSAEVAACRSIPRLVRSAGEAERVVLVGPAEGRVRRALSRRIAWVPSFMARATPPAARS